MAVPQGKSQKIPNPTPQIPSQFPRIEKLAYVNAHMPATVHVVARFRARSGKEQALKSLLTALVAPTRRELGCYQYDLLENTGDPRELSFVERWDGDKAVDQHLETEHVKNMLAQVGDLVEAPPDIRRYRLV